MADNHDHDRNFYDDDAHKLPKDIATTDGSDRPNFSNTSADQRHEYIGELWWSLLRSFLNDLHDPETKLKGSTLQVIVGFLKDNGMTAEALQEASHGGGRNGGGIFGSKLAETLASLQAHDDDNGDGDDPGGKVH